MRVLPDPFLLPKCDSETEITMIIHKLDNKLFSQ